MDQHGQSQRRRSQQTYRQQSQLEATSSAQALSAASRRQTAYETAQYSAGTGFSPMHLVPEMPVTETARQQSHQFSHYDSGFAYQQGVQTSQPSYEQVSQYRQRPVTTSETMDAQFGMPQYYLAGQGVTSGGSLTDMTSQTIPSQYILSDGYADAGSLNTYTSGLMDQSQQVAYNPYMQQQQYTPNLQVPSNDQPFESYQTQIRNVFTLARDGALREVGARLLDVSQYLLGNVEGLGLTRDDETLHDGRIQLWDEFNRAWLVSLQRQLDLSKRMMRNQPLDQNQSIMDSQTLERLSSELVRLCDPIEKHGLVDYQMGVAEEEIMEILMRCISLLNGKGNRRGASSSEASSASASRRR